MELNNRRKYKINEFYFDEINSEQKAYMLGILYADGSILPKRNSISLRLKEEDKEILENLKVAISYEGPLRYDIRKIYNKSFNSKNTWGLNITSKRLCSKIQEIGCRQNKTFSCTFPNIPEDLFPHFIRGYFDGDGCLYQGKERFEWSIIGTKEFVTVVQNIIFDKLNIKKNKIYQKGKLFYLKYGSTSNIKILQDWLYKDATIFLKRKFKIIK